jgi:uncharacterized protein YbjT (DUF2867 family)
MTDRPPNPAPEPPPQGASGGLGRVLVVGASGLVGRQAVRQCLHDPGVSEVRVLLRRHLALDELLGPHTDLDAAQRARFQPHVIDFTQLDRCPGLFDVNTVFCSLGTTLRQAGSREAFRRVDFEWPLQVARLARANGASRFLLVSAVGADSASRVFYNRVKGELEDAVSDIGFEQLCLARPSLLQGDRSEFRFGEHMGLLLGRALGFLVPESHQPVHVSQVAAGLLAAARAGRPGRQVVSNAALRTQPRAMG